MSKVTIAQARRMLPDFAAGLGMYAHTVTTLRDAVLQELEDHKAGANPLTEMQVRQLQRFLEKTA